MEAPVAALGKIEGFLRENAGQAYCDDCLSEVLKIRPGNKCNRTQVAWLATIGSRASAAPVTDTGTMKNWSSGSEWRSANKPTPPARRQGQIST